MYLSWIEARIKRIRWCPSSIWIAHPVVHIMHSNIVHILVHNVYIRFDFNIKFFLIKTDVLRKSIATAPEWTDGNRGTYRQATSSKRCYEIFKILCDDLELQSQRANEPNIKMHNIFINDSVVTENYYSSKKK